MRQSKGKSRKAGRRAHRIHPKEYAVKVNVRVEIYCERGKVMNSWSGNFKNDSKLGAVLK